MSNDKALTNGQQTDRGKKPEHTILQIFLSLLPKKEKENFLR